MSSLQLDNTTTEIRFHAIGGDSDKEINDWLKSVDIAIMFLDDTLAMTTDPIRPAFTPIWQLADSAHQAAVKQAWLVYLPAEQQQDDALAAGDPRTAQCQHSGGDRWLPDRGGERGQQRRRRRDLCLQRRQSPTRQR